MAEAYEIGVKILMGGNMAEALGLMSSKLLGIHGQTKEIEKSLANWKGLVGGAALALGGIEVLKGLKDIVEHGAKLEKFEAQAKAAGYTIADQANMIGAAWKNAGTNINASVSDSYKNLLELAQVTGSVSEAMRMLPAFTRADNALASLKDDDIKSKVHTSSQSYDFARSLELLGVTQNEAKLDAYTGTITKEIVGMRGLIDGSKLFQGIQNAGGARYGWNEDFVGHVLGPLIQASPRNGTGLFQLDRSFGSGVMTEMMAQGAEKYGLFDKADENRDAHGRWKGMKTGSIAGYDELRANPEAWALDVLLPKLKAAGVDTNDTNAMSKAISEISRGNKNLNVILDELLLPANRAQLAKERANIDRVPDDAATVLQKNDPALAMQAFTTQWDNLLTALGKPVVHDAVRVLEELTGIIQSLAKAAADHPEITRISVEVTAVAASLAVLAGTVKVLQIALNMGKGAAALNAIGAGGSGSSGVAGGAVAGAAGSGVLGRLGVLGAVIAATEWLDPDGNFGGLTSPIDNWFKEHLGIDPSNLHLPSLAGDAAGSTKYNYALLDSWAMERGRRNAIDFRNDPESAHGRAMGSPDFARANPPPIVKTTVMVYVDGHLIPSRSSVSNDSNSFDGRQSPAMPDNGGRDF